MTNVKGLLTIVQPAERGLRLGNDTRFVFADGTELTHVTRCVVEFSRDQFVMATLDLAIDQLENIEAHPMLSLESVTAAALHYGFELTKLPDALKLARQAADRAVALAIRKSDLT